MEGNRNMNMWAFIFLCILGLHTCQVNGEDLSTQMYYPKLKIEKSAIGNITSTMTSLGGNSSYIVDNIQMTTTCKPSSADTECTCESGHKWSDNVCELNEKCCGSDTCTFPTDSAHMCVSNTAVSFKGSFTMKGKRYRDCLSVEESKYKTCNDKLIEEIKKVYSTLKGFDVFKINKYRFGSIVADFEMTVAFYVRAPTLIDKTEKLTATLEASLQLNTTGIVKLIMPDNPVKYSAKRKLLCTSKEDFNSIPVWKLKNLNSKVCDITNGTEATITPEGRTVRLDLKKITEVWAGEYTCTYCQSSPSFQIFHIASAVMDVALLPIIHMTTVPSFPRCQNSDDLEVEGNCEIGESHEIYTVKWTSNYEDTIIPQRTVGLLSKAQMQVSCSRTAPKPWLSCTFSNRLNQTRAASVDINIIYAGEKFCEAKGDWEETKAGFTAVLQCKNTVGQRRMKCSDNATWTEEKEVCVNKDLTGLLQHAQTVDNGVGSLDGNAADLCSRLQNVTKDTKEINTYPSVQASVDVLSVIRDKLISINNGQTVDDLLDSSSNLMEPSLEKSWNETDEGNLTLAEKYLSCVERLIEASNITAIIKKENIEVATCKTGQGLECNNTAWGVTVNFRSANKNATVKTTGIQQLGKYMPAKDQKYELNSIIVTTTTETKLSDSVKVGIDFKLLSKRPRNVKIKCVYWENTTGQWSTEGCEWEGPWGDSGRCTCNHLSSFAILMAKEPIKLSGMTEITVVGLSISIISLVISLAIEFIVWSAVVKTNSLYLRHVSHVNISLCLLVADCCFLASSERKNITELWCLAFVVLKHFCYLSMFFWMLCLSSTLLHQAVFLFHSVSRKNYLRFSLILGYGCPLFIVVLTVLLNNGGTEGLYYHTDTCWLVYIGLFKGSIHSFLIPIGTIVFVNVFAMVLVIIKLLDHSNHSEMLHDKERIAAKTVVRTVILLTPIFGVTWIFGFAVTILDLSSGLVAIVANYAFILMNSFQGLFILLTTCLGDQKTREALLNYLKKKVPASISESSTK